MTHRTAGGRRAARRTLLKTLPALVLAAAGSTGPLRPLGAEEPDPERGPYRFGVFPYLPALKIDAISVSTLSPGQRYRTRAVTACWLR